MRIGKLSLRGRALQSQPLGAPGRRPVPHLGLALFAIACSLTAQSAFAQVNIDTTQYTSATGANDMATMAFTSLLGTFFTNPFAALGSASTLLGSMFLVFNLFVLTAGTIWATYGVGVAVVQTAHEGQLMGKRMSQIWMPIRMVTGVASLIPAFGGFSLSQAVLVFATTIGIGAANLGYNTMIDGANNMTTLVSPAIVSPVAAGSSSLKEAAFALFRAEICMLAQNDYAAQQQNVTGLDQTAIRITKTTQQANPPVATGGALFGTPANAAYCGGVNVTATNVTTRSGSSVGGYRVASVNYDWIAQQVASRATGGFANFSNQITALADTWYQQYQSSGGTRSPVPVAQIEGIAANYYASIQPDSTTANQQAGAVSTQAIASMKQYGWFGAGAWSATLAEVNAAVAQAAQGVDFRTIPPQVATQAGGYNTDLDATMKVFDSAMQTASYDPYNGTSNASSSTNQALCHVLSATFVSAPTGNCSFGQNFAMTLIDYSTAGAGGATGGGSNIGGNSLRLVDPIVAMKNMGDYMMVSAETLYTVYSYLSAASESTGLLGNLAGKVLNLAASSSAIGMVLAPLKGIVSILPLLVGSMFILGLLMSIWIPLIPFVTWWGGLVQYLTIFFEGIVAGPIWAFVHLDAQGEGMGSRTETGYLFIINMLFRPFLMLLGFVASLALMIVMGSFLFWLYPNVMANAQGNSITGLFSVLGYLIVFWVLMHTLVQALSNMSVMLPDQALAWAGRAIGAQLGRETESQSRGHFVAIGRFGSQGAGNIMTAAAEAGKRQSSAAAAPPVAGPRQRKSGGGAD